MVHLLILTLFEGQPGYTRSVKYGHEVFSPPSCKIGQSQPDLLNFQNFTPTGSQEK